MPMREPPASGASSTMRAIAPATLAGARNSPSALRWMKRSTAGKSALLAARMSACMPVSITPGLMLSTLIGWASVVCSTATERTTFSSPALAPQYSDQPAMPPIAAPEEMFSSVLRQSRSWKAAIAALISITGEA